MSPLFGKSEEKSAEIAAALAEADRLGALAPEELAVELMPVFGPDGPKGRGPDGGINLLQVEAGLLDKTPRATKYMAQLQQAVREALQVLEHAELINKTSRQSGTWYNATRLGQTALTDGTVQQQVQERG